MREPEGRRDEEDGRFDQVRSSVSCRSAVVSFAKNLMRVPGESEAPDERKRQRNISYISHSEGGESSL